MNISKELIEECKVNFIDLTELVFLYTQFIGEDWNLSIFPSSITKLQRMGLINKDSDLTESGELLVKKIVNPTIVKKEVAHNFEEFWQAFPKDDEHSNFPKTRAIRVNKALAENEYKKLLANENITEEQLINALNLEVAWRKSFRASNFLTYLKSPANWLIHKAYLDSENYTLSDTDEGYGKEVI